MCVIAYKPKNINFPSDSILKNCYENNPDGAGFMYAFNGEVHIQKGYTSWESFKNALNRAREKTGDNVPYVMHFRIATQGFEKTMTHPFPLSSKMSNLKKIKCNANIGVAHNGVLLLTSDGSKSYSDTMLFITDYLSCIIRNYSWYKDERTKMLIERLIEGSRLAILDKNGHCELMGKGWIKDKDIHYSNSSYSYKKYVFLKNNYFNDDYYWGDGYSWNDDFYFKNDKESKKEKKRLALIDPSDPYEKYFNYRTGLYDFPSCSNCPSLLENDNSYCASCSRLAQCDYIKAFASDNQKILTELKSIKENAYK